MGSDWNWLRIVSNGGLWLLWILNFRFLPGIKTVGSVHIHGGSFFSGIPRMHAPVDPELKVSGNFHSTSV
jgi:hypothetical protein